MPLKAVLAVVGGGIVGLLLSALSRKTGSTCVILCNPVVAAIYGAVLGLLLVLGQDQPQK
ncbi:MAG: hypothetical protein ACUVTY_14080 [Armatimonadota bacterium]